MADDADDESGEVEDQNQYGGGDQEIDAVEQTERMEDDETDDEEESDDSE